MRNFAINFILLGGGTLLFAAATWLIISCFIGIGQALLTWVASLAVMIS